MKAFITSLFLTLGLTANFAHAAAQTQTIKAEVNGMVCAFCAQGIEKKLRSMSETKDVYVNLKEKVVAVELKEGQTVTPDRVKEVIKEAGYDVSRTEIVNQTALQIKAATPKE